MSNNGWVKLHRKILQNELFISDKTALLIFIHLLIVVDRSEGTWSGGRFQLADLCGLNPNTTKDALKRLKRHKIITTQSTTKYTTYTICNWTTYQSHGTTNRHQQNTTKPLRARHHSNKNVATKNKEERSERGFEKPLASTKSFKNQYERLQAQKTNG